MGILDDIEKIDEEEGIKATLKKIEKLQEENNRLLKEILRRMKDEKKRSEKRRD